MGADSFHVANKVCPPVVTIFQVLPAVTPCSGWPLPPTQAESCSALLWGLETLYKLAIMKNLNSMTGARSKLFLMTRALNSTWSIFKNVDLSGWFRGVTMLHLPSNCSQNSFNEVTTQNHLLF